MLECLSILMKLVKAHTTTRSRESFSQTHPHKAGQRHPKIYVWHHVTAALQPRILEEEHSAHKIGTHRAQKPGIGREGTG